MNRPLPQIVGQILIAVSVLIGGRCPLELRAQDSSAAKPVDVGSRRELFVDDFLIDSLKNVRLQLQHLQPQEIALVCDQLYDADVYAFQFTNQ